MNTYQSEKLAFYRWVNKWVSKNNVSTEGGPVDLPQIAAVLRAMGYKLETVDYVSVNNKSTDTTKIEVQCNKSGMRAVLTKQIDSCICPNSKTTNEGHFWVVSGMGPSSSQDNLNRVDETHSNLIPDISKEKSMLVKEILTQLFAIISEVDMNLNKEYITCSDSLTRPTLFRQDTWEMCTPPLCTSSPLPKFTKSISQTSLNIDKEQVLAEILMMVRENLDKAIIMLPSKHDNTFTKPNENQVPDTEDIRKIKDTSTLQLENYLTISNKQVNKTPSKLHLQENKENTPNTSFSNMEVNTTPTRLQLQQNNENILNTSFSNKQANKTPLKFQLQQNNKERTSRSSSKLTEKREFITPSKFGTFRKKIESQTPKNYSTSFVKKDTPIPISKKLSLQMSPRLPERRFSLGQLPKNSNIKTSLNLSACSPTGTIVKPKTSIPSFGFKSSPVNSNKLGVPQLAKPK